VGVRVKVEVPQEEALAVEDTLWVPLGFTVGLPEAEKDRLTVALRVPGAAGSREPEGAVEVLAVEETLTLAQALVETLVDRVPVPLPVAADVPVAPALAVAAALREGEEDWEAVTEMVVEGEAPAEAVPATAPPPRKVGLTEGEGDREGERVPETESVGLGVGVRVAPVLALPKAALRVGGWLGVVEREAVEVAPAGEGVVV
jgi:hypothetical protein